MRLKCILGIRTLLVVHELTLKFVACQRPVAIAHFQVSRCHGCNGAASHLQVWGHVHLSRCICHRAANLVSTSARRCLRLTSHWQAVVWQVWSPIDNMPGWLFGWYLTVLSTPALFPQIDIIGAMVIVWRVRAKIIRSVLCNIVCNNGAECDAHTYEQT